MNWFLILLIAYGIIALAVAAYILFDVVRNGDVHSVSDFAIATLLVSLMGIAWPVGLVEALASSARMGGGR